MAVYKKYIKKRGKIFGPYLYETKRVDGKVVNKYLGLVNENYEKDKGGVKEGKTENKSNVLRDIANAKIVSNYDFYAKYNKKLLVISLILGIAFIIGISLSFFSFFFQNKINVSDYLPNDLLVFLAPGTENIDVQESANLVQRIEIGKPVKWIKKVKIDLDDRIFVPKEAENIVVKIDKKDEKENKSEEEKRDQENFEEAEDAKVASNDIKEVNETINKSLDVGENSIITDNIEINESETNESSSEMNESIGEVLASPDIIESSIIERGESKEIDISDLAVESGDEYLIEYVTPAPVAIEEEISEFKKIVRIDGPDLGYENILSYVELPEILTIEKKNSIKVYWVEESSYEEFEAFDRDDDGLIDYVEWNVPHLSEQTFEISILILTVQSYPTVGGNWTVLFNTSGTGDLRIWASNLTRWSEDSEEYDLKFLEVKCGENTIIGEFIKDDENCMTDSCYVLFNNYSCIDSGREISKVLTRGKHTLKFEFGDEIAYAYNFASDFINFIPPTPTDGEISRKIEHTFNVSINMSNLKEVKFNWNKTNYSIYDDSLVLMMNFENRSVLGENYTFVRDISKYGNNGTCSEISCPDWNMFGKYGGGFKFNGVSKKDIIVGDSDNLDFINNFTIALWVNTTSPSTDLYQSALVKGADNGLNPRAYSIYLTNNQPENHYYNGQWRFFRSGYTITPHVWHHIVYVRDSVQEYFYVDGILVKYGSIAAPVVADSTSLRIGGTPYFDDTERFNGTVDEVRMWNRTFSQEEIEVLYRSNLEQYDKDKWNLLVTRFNLPDGIYEYQASIKNETNSAATEKRLLIIESSITECSVLNQQNGIYTLTGDILSSGTCLNVTANNILIDCDGNEIRYANSNVKGNGIYSVGNFTKIKNCNIIEQTSAGDSYGIFLRNSNGHYLSNVSITTIGSSSSGLYLSNTTGNLIENLKTSLSGGTAHSIDLAKDNVQFILRDSSLSSLGANGFDFNVQNQILGGEWNFTNVSFADKSIAGAGILNVHWYLNAIILDSLFAGIADANLNVKNAFNVSKDLFSLSSGEVPREEIIQYNQSTVGLLNFGPYLLNATHPIYASKNMTLDFTQSRSAIFVLNKSPEIDMIYPIDGEKINIEQQSFVSLNFSLNDLENDVMDLWVYGSKDSLKIEEFLLYYRKNIPNGFYNITWKESPVDPSSGGLVLLLHLDNNSAFRENISFAYDFSGQGNNGSVNVSEFDYNGKFAGAYKFNGLSKKDIIVADSDNLDFINTFSIALWVNTTSPSTDLYQSALVKGADNGLNPRAYSIYLINNQPAFSYYNSGWRIFNSDVSIAPHVWNHIAYVRDNVQEHFYVNGKLVKSGNIAGSILVDSTSLRIGGSPYFDDSERFNGTVDEIAIWNRSLNSWEIQDLLNLTFGMHHWRVKADDQASVSRMTESFIMTNPPFTEKHVFNSTLGTNLTTEDLECYVSAMDAPNEKEYITAHWKLYRNNLIYNSGVYDLRTEMLNDSSMMFFYHFNNDPLFNENSTFVHDHSGRHNNATFVCGTICPIFVNGYFGKAVNFSWVSGGASNHHLRIADSDDLIFGINVSISSWVFFVNPGTEDHEIISHKGSGRGYTIGVTDDPGNVSKLRFDYKDSSGASHDHYSKKNISTKNWHFITLVREKGNIKFYVDGLLDSDIGFRVGSSENANTLLINPTSDMWIGDSVEGQTDEEWNGAIEEIAFWNRSLSENEVYGLYLRGKGVGILKNITKVGADITNNGEEWICSVFMSNQFKNETFISNRSLIIGQSPPGISFVEPTLPNNSFTRNSSVMINVSILTGQENIKKISLDWNGTNFSFYDDTLILMMNFENKSILGENNNIVRDMSKYGNNGSVFGSAVWNSISRHGGAYRYDGIDDFVNLSSNSFLNQDFKELSISFWMLANPQSAPDAGLVGKGTSSYGLTFDRGLGVWFYIVDGGNQVSTNLESGNWHYVTGVFNGTSLLLYIDGELKSTKLNSLYPSTGTGGEFYIGKAASLFNGSIDEVRMWNRTLSPSEVVEQYYSNLYKYDIGKFILNINQSNLSTGIYKYKAYAYDISDIGNATEQRFLNVNTSLKIIDISNLGFKNINPGGVKFIEFSVLVEKGGGAIANLNGSFDRKNIVRSNFSCARVADVNPNIANYSCSVDIWYFDESGLWNVSAAAADVDGGTSKLREAFVLSSDTYIDNQRNLSYTNLVLGDLNKEKTFSINNTGNTAISSIKIMGNNLTKSGDISFIPAQNFTVGSASGCSGSLLIDRTFITLPGITLPVGNNSAGQGITNLFICLKQVPVILPSGSYEAKSGNAWQLDFV